MNDLEVLEDYLNEPEEKVEEAPKDAPIDFSKASNVIEFPKTPSVSIEKGPKVMEIIDAHKKKPAGSLLGKGLKAKKTTEKAFNAAVPSLDDIPVPSGGIGLLLFISLFVVFAITPLNGTTGMTRLQIVWQTILGNYTLNGNGAGAEHTSAAPQAATFTPVSTIPGLSNFIQGGMV